MKPLSKFLLAILLLTVASVGWAGTVVSDIPDLDYGRYHALVIGNNNYHYLSDLKTAVYDAQGIASLLEEEYGFEVDLLENATRSEIVKALSRYQKTVAAVDNLLIYYAGHGYLDQATDEGYWLPIDANSESLNSWLATDHVIDQIRAMEAKHVIVVADSVFSGTMIRPFKIELRTPSDLQKIIQKKARTALTSGGLEPVMDSGGDKYSVFARSLISLLEENTGVLDASQLFRQLRPKVMVKSTLTPEYGDIHQAGHDGGDFLFVRQSGESQQTVSISTSTLDLEFWESIRDSDNPEYFREYMRKFPNGTFLTLVKLRLKQLESAARPTTTQNLVWCASNTSAVRILESDCKTQGGESYVYQYQAVAEHNRLKEAQQPETTTLFLSSNVSGNKVYIDGVFKGSTRLYLDLPKGKHTIRVEKDGYEPYEKTINLTQAMGLSADLLKIPAMEFEPPSLEPLDEIVVLAKRKNIRENPDVASSRLDQLSVGTEITALGKVSGKNWYLIEYADGKQGYVFDLSLGTTSGSVAQPGGIPNLNYGRYHALVIGNNDYDYLRDLKTAINDASKVASVLEYDYGFEVELLKNATRSKILNSLLGYRKKLDENDNLLIYYAGHGAYDEDANKAGYWLPVDADKEDPSNWLATDRVVGMITAMEAKHVMVVADSCFSGELTRGITIDYGSPNWIHALVEKRSRVALTSGDLEPVSDGGGSHSVFAKVFISLLEENTGVLNTAKLFSELQPRVIKNARQTPRHGTIRYAGDDGGDFLFVRQ